MNRSETGPFNKRLRISAGLISLGLIVQASTLFTIHHAAFLIFAIFGVTLVAVGVVGFLWSLLSLN